MDTDDEKVNFRLSLTRAQVRMLKVAAANAGMTVSAWVAAQAKEETESTES